MSAKVHLPIADAGPSVRGSIEQDGRRRLIVPATVHGRFATARRIVFALLLAAWAALPWIRVRGTPAVFLDVEARRFYLFGATLNAQDGWLVFFLLTGVGFGLVFLTALAGRAFCGWACPQTVFIEAIFRPIERFFEGPRDKHLRRDAGKPTFARLLRKIGKHTVYVAAALLVAHVVLAYFVSIPRLVAMVRSDPMAHPEAFLWVVGVTALCYLDFAWFREQFCVLMCPYGRIQSTLLDDESLVVGYDTARGEPRGKKGTSGAGDCVDCKRCVVVCPTAIDIRDGLQLDCIACTACIDACDETMDRLARPRGLIRYDSARGFAGETRRIVRPRLVAYAGLLAVGALAFGAALAHRTDFEAKVTRLPGPPFEIREGTIRDGFEVHLVNKRSEEATFDVEVQSPAAGVAVVATPRVRLGSLEGTRVPFFVSMPVDAYRLAAPVEVRVVREGTGDATTTTLPFLGAKR